MNLRRLYPLNGFPQQRHLWSWISFDVANQSFTLIINTFMFWLAGVVGTNFGVGFSVEGFLPAFLGGN